MNPKNPKDIDGAEISWFAPLCDGDDDFLGNRNTDYKSTWENTSKILAEHYIDLPNLINNIKKATNKASDEFHYLVNIDQIGISVAEDIINFFNSSTNSLNFDVFVSSVDIVAAIKSSLW